MENDFLKELAFLGVTARIKRLSESLFYSIKDLYQAQNITIEPSWHLVFLVLKERQQMTMLDLAQVLGLSKPAVTKMIRKMEGQGYVAIRTDRTDHRKKRVVLSAKAQKELPQLERIWEAGQQAVEQMLATNPHFMQALEELEQQQQEESFCDRALKNLQP